MPNETPVSVETPVTETPASETVKPETPESTVSEKPKDEKPVETPAQIAKRKYKYKVDGEEIEEELSDEEIVKNLQLSKASGKRFKEAADTRDKMLQLFEQAKKDPAEFFKVLGVNPREFAEKYLYDVYKEEDLPEGERARLTAERKAAELEKQLKDREQAEKDAKKQAEVERYKQEYDTQIATALQDAKLPRTPLTVKRVAAYMAKALEKEVDIELPKIVELVVEDYQNEIKEIYGSADPEMIKKMLGDEKAKELIKAVSKDAAKDRPENRAEKVESKTSTRQQKKKTWDELQKEINEQLGQ